MILTISLLHYETDSPDLRLTPSFPCTGQLGEELGRVRKQLDECRAENVSLFEKVWGVTGKGV